VLSDKAFGFSPVTINISSEVISEPIKTFQLILDLKILNGSLSEIHSIKVEGGLKLIYGTFLINYKRCQRLHINFHCEMPNTVI
jgi:hypothetical protein